MLLFLRLITNPAAGFQNCPWVTTITYYFLPPWALIFVVTSHNSCSGKAKTSKKAKVIKTAEDPKVHEPEQQIPVSDAFVPQPEEPVHDVPPEIPDLSSDQTNINPLNTKSSSSIKP